MSANSPPTPPFQTGGAVISSPAVDGYGRVFVGSSDHKLYAIDAATGAQEAVFQAADADLVLSGDRCQ